VLSRSLGHFLIKSNWHVKKSQVIGLGEVGFFYDVMEHNDILCIFEAHYRSLWNFYYLWSGFCI